MVIKEENDAYFASLEITKEVSRECFKTLEGLKADVHNPDFVLNIDVRYGGTFIFTDVIMGLGGFPSGILGKTVLMISGGIDSVIARYEVIKKGMDVEAVHFASPPHTSDMALQKVVDLLQELTIYTSNQNINLHVVPFTKIQDEIYKHVREDYGITIMRRIMYRIAEKLSIFLNISWKLFLFELYYKNELVGKLVFDLGNNIINYK